MVVAPQIRCWALKPSHGLCFRQHRLRWDPEAQKLGHRAEERGDRHREEEYQGAAGLPGSHPTAQRPDAVSPGGLKPHRVL